MTENDYIESDYYVSFDAVFRAIDEYDDYVIDDETGEWYIPISKALSLIENVPPADVVEVVRCKYCEQFVPNSKIDLLCSGFCRKANWSKKWNDFCSDGERRAE